MTETSDSSEDVIPAIAGEYKVWEVDGRLFIKRTYNPYSWQVSAIISGALLCASIVFLVGAIGGESGAFFGFLIGIGLAAMAATASTSIYRSTNLAFVFDRHSNSFRFGGRVICDLALIKRIEVLQRGTPSEGWYQLGLALSDNRIIEPEIRSPWVLTSGGAAKDKEIMDGLATHIANFLNVPIMGSQYRSFNKNNSQ